MHGQIYKGRIYTIQEKKYYTNTGLLKHGFQAIASCDYGKCSVSTFSFHAGIAGDRLMEPSFLPPRLTGDVYTISYATSSRAVVRCGSAD
jgi:hypothetical protein